MCDTMHKRDVYYTLKNATLNLNIAFLYIPSEFHQGDFFPEEERKNGGKNERKRADLYFDI